MTATRPPANLIGSIDRALCALAWVCQVGVAALYLAITFQPAVWRAMLHEDLVTTACEWVFAGGMALLWMIGLWQEQISFYHRRKRRLYRQSWILGHVSVLFIATLAASAQKDRVGLWIILGMGALTATMTWTTWMHTRRLPAEDQAVIDAIHARQAQQAAAAFDASQKEQRRQRLSAIVNSLGYELTDTPAGIQDESPAARWQIPRGKHASLVYFIRNGNRMKIGTSTELRRRIRTLALRAENVALLYNGDRRLERQYHDQFKDLRIGNTEWFAYEGALLEHVRTETVRLSGKDQQK